MTRAQRGRWWCACRPGPQLRLPPVPGNRRGWEMDASRRRNPRSWRASAGHSQNAHPAFHSMMHLLKGRKYLELSLGCVVITSRHIWRNYAVSMTFHSCTLIRIITVKWQWVITVQNGNILRCDSSFPAKKDKHTISSKSVFHYEIYSATLCTAWHRTQQYIIRKICYFNYSTNYKMQLQFQCKARCKALRPPPFFFLNLLDQLVYDLLPA